MGQAKSLPALYVQKGGPADALLQQCPSLHAPYQPPALLVGANVHLMAAAALHSCMHTSMMVQRQPVALEDGGNISLDWWSPAKRAGKKGKLFSQSSKRIAPDAVPCASAAPVVLILHAFSGSSKDGYVRSMAAWCLKEGWQPVSMNMRGCGDLQLTSCKPTIPNLSNDLYAAVKVIRDARPDVPIFGVGFSNGAYTFTKYVAEVDSGLLPADGRLAGCIAAHSGFDYDAEMNKISKGNGWLSIDLFERLYWRAYVEQHKQQLRLNDAVDWKAVSKSSSVKELESHLILPVWGYENMEEYHGELKALRQIPQIKTPYLFVSAEDDMCLDMSIVPDVVRCIEASPYTALAMTRLGSHCAHIRSGAVLRLRTFVDDAAIEFMSAILKSTSSSAEQLSASPSLSTSASQKSATSRRNSRSHSGSRTSIAWTCSSDLAAPLLSCLPKHLSGGSLTNSFNEGGQARVSATAGPVAMCLNHVELLRSVPPGL